MSLYFLFAALMVLPQPSQDFAPPISLEDRLFMPYVDLMQPAEYSPEDFASVRSHIEHERDERIKAAREQEQQWKAELDSARSELDELNRRGSVDTPAAGARRKQLHVDIGALERGIHQKIAEYQAVIPAEYDERITKLWLVEHWPDARHEILQRIDRGESRQRPHGDVEDIGFRIIAEKPEDDIEPGRQAVRQMTVAGWLPSELRDEPAQAYIRGLANQLAAHSDLKVPLHVTLVDAADLKIVSLPGGFIYLSSGVVAAANSESELACILSREIARIAARHAARASKRSVVSKMFLPVAQIAMGLFSPGLNQAAYYGIGYGMQGLNGVLDRLSDGAVEKYQKEADQLGAQYAWTSGFDPRGGIQILDSLDANDEAALYAAKPVLRERLLNLFREIEFLGPVPRPVSESAEFGEVRARLAKMGRGN